MSSAQADNVTMSGGGLYSLATKGAKDVIDMATPRVIAAVESMDLSAPSFTMADVGCADGGTSLDMIRKVLASVQIQNPDCQCTIIYTDQPANDFNALIGIVHGKTQFDSWTSEFPNAHALVSGSSFYLQAVPDASLDMVFSATAMHWLSRKPRNLDHHVHMVGASGEEYQAFANQARQDWETILLCRARELRPGGRMVLVNFCRDPQGRYLGNTGGVNMFDTMNDIWREFVASGSITEQEYQAMTLPQYYNTVEEFIAPLETPGNPVHQAGLRLEGIETRIVPCPFAQQYARDGNVQQFADGLIPTIRSWNQSIFRAGLSDRRSEQDKRALMEQYYASYHRRVLENPQGHGMDYVHAYMTIFRT